MGMWSEARLLTMRFRLLCRRRTLTAGFPVRLSLVRVRATPAQGPGVSDLRFHHLDESRVSGVVLPRLDDEQMESLGLRAFAVRTARHNAVTREREARTLVERWIERQETT